MSREQANTYQKHRDAEDAGGNLAWAARLQQKALRCGPEAMARIDVEREFELGDDEKVIWRLLKLPRKYMDLEHCGLLPIEKMRGVLRGLVAADVVDIVDLANAKALIPAEIKRIKAEVQGKELQKPREPLRARVYRPSLDGAAPAPEQPAAPPAPPPSTAEVPAPPASGSSSGGFKAPPTSGSFKAPPTTNPGGGAGLNDDDRRFRDEILRAHGAMAKQNHYEFLGIPRTADDAAVRQAYVKLAREYHPDRAAGGALGGDDELRSKIDALFKRLGDAQQKIGTADARSAYERELEALGGAGAGGGDGKRARRPLEAQNAYKMAETYFKKRDFKQAEAHYRQAVMFDGEDPKILTALAYCVWMNPDLDEKMRSDDAKKRLTEVLQKYKYADAAYKLGLVLRKANDESAAQRHFGIANKLDPNHVDAQREVRLAQMRHDKTAQDKKDANSLFGKFLKK